MCFALASDGRLFHAAMCSITELTSLVFKIRETLWFSSDFVYLDIIVDRYFV